MSEMMCSVSARCHVYVLLVLGVGMGVVEEGWILFSDWLMLVGGLDLNRHESLRNHGWMFRWILGKHEEG